MAWESLSVENLDSEKEGCTERSGYKEKGESEDLT